MTDNTLRGFAAAGLVIGALFGMAGTFVPSPNLRALAWGIDGTALIVSTALLAMHHLQRGDAHLAAGFLVFMVGVTLIVSGSAMDFAVLGPTLAGGTGLWAASLALISASSVIPPIVRGTGAVAAVMFAITALELYGGRALTPLSQPLPFFAFPFLAMTLLGWAWAHTRSQLASSGGGVMASGPTRGADRSRDHHAAM
jgi:hypothetical protein